MSNGKNLDLARAFVGVAEAQGRATTLLDLTTLDLPVFTPRTEAEGVPSAITPVLATFTEASRFVFCGPEYNGSTPPCLTNVIAWLSTATDDFRQVFNGKGAVLATHSGGHGQKMLMALRMQLSHMGVNVVGRELQTNDKKPYRISSIEALLAELV